jgi:hypothetical protein
MALYLILAFIFPLSSRTQNNCSYKRVFYGEADTCFDRATGPSKSVVSAILKTKDAKESFDYLEPSERYHVSSLFKGLTVHLRSQSQQDMVVRGNPPMTGGDNTWFWIVTSVNHNPTAFWIQGNVVTVLNTRHHGYLDIRTDWAAGSHRATRIFRHNGSQYKLFHEDYEDTRP